MVGTRNRLLMLVPSVSSAFGEQVELLVRHLRDYGVQVFLVVPSHYHEDRPLHIDDWVFKTKGSKWVTAMRLSSPITLWSLTRHFFRVRPHCTYIYCCEAYPPAVLMLFLSRLRRTTCVLSIHDAAPHPGKLFDFVHGKVRLPFIYLASTLHTFSEHGRDILSRRFPRKLVVESPLLDLAELYLGYPTAQYAADKVILCFGRIEPYKDIPCVVAAFSSLWRDHSDVKLRIVGKNGLGDKLFSITQGVPNCKVIDKFLPPLALAEEIARAQVCIFAYSEASHSGGAELALSLGCNVVATKVAAFNNMNGLPGVFLFEPGNAQDCAYALWQAVNAPKRSRDPRALQLIVGSNRKRVRHFLEKVQVLNVTRPARS